MGTHPSLNRKRAYLLAEFVESGGEGAIEERVAEVDLKTAQDLGVGVIFDSEVGVTVLFIQGLVEAVLLVCGQRLIKGLGQR